MVEAAAGAAATFQALPLLSVRLVLKDVHCFFSLENASKDRHM